MQQFSLQGLVLGSPMSLQMGQGSQNHSGWLAPAYNRASTTCSLADFLQDDYTLPERSVKDLSDPLGD